MYNRHGTKQEDLSQLYAYVKRYKRASTAILESLYFDGLPEKRIRMYAINLEDGEVTIDKLTNIIQENLGM